MLIEVGILASIMRERATQKTTLGESNSASGSALQLMIVSASGHSLVEMAVMRESFAAHELLFNEKQIELYPMKSGISGRNSRGIPFQQFLYW